MNLVSEYFESSLNIGASVVGPLTCVVAFSVLNGSSKRKLRTIAGWTFAGFLVAIFTCLGLQANVGLIFYPSPIVTEIIWWVWSAVYIAMFVFFAACVVSATLSFPVVKAKNALEKNKSDLPEVNI